MGPKRRFPNSGHNTHTSHNVYYVKWWFWRLINRLFPTSKVGNQSCLPQITIGFLGLCPVQNAPRNFRVLISKVRESVHYFRGDFPDDDQGHDDRLLSMFVSKKIILV